MEKEVEKNEKEKYGNSFNVYNGIRGYLLYCVWKS